MGGDIAVSFLAWWILLNEIIHLTHTIDCCRLGVLDVSIYVLLVNLTCLSKLGFGRGERDTRLCQTKFRLYGKNVYLYVLYL